MDWEHFQRLGLTKILARGQIWGTHKCWHMRKVIALSLIIDICGARVTFVICSNILHYARLVLIWVRLLYVFDQCTRFSKNTYMYRYLNKYWQTFMTWILCDSLLFSSSFLAITPAILLSSSWDKNATLKLLKYPTDTACLVWYAKPFVWNQDLCICLFHDFS